jgi:hypothetical protein
MRVFLDREKYLQRLDAMGAHRIRAGINQENSLPNRYKPEPQSRGWLKVQRRGQSLPRALSCAS